MYRAAVQTRSFSFDAYGETATDAWITLCRGWDCHVKQTGATLTWVELREDVVCEQVKPGVCYRDGEEI